MKRLIEFPLGDSNTVLVEVEEEAAPEGRLRGSHSAEAIEKAHQAFDSSLEKIKPIAASVIGKLREVSDSPEQIAVEFGIKLNASAGVVLASSAIESNFKVTLTWKRAAKA